MGRLCLCVLLWVVGGESEGKGRVKQEMTLIFQGPKRAFPKRLAGDSKSAQRHRGHVNARSRINSET